MTHNVIQILKGYLSLSLNSSTTLMCFLVGLCGGCCPETPISLSGFPLLGCLDTSSVLASAPGLCGGFSSASWLLLPLAWFTGPLPVMVVLLRRVTGPFISALSLISAGQITQFLPAGHRCFSGCLGFLCYHPEGHIQSAEISPSRSGECRLWLGVSSPLLLSLRLPRRCWHPPFEKTQNLCYSIHFRIQKRKCTG